MRRIVELKDHPANKDRSAVLVSGWKERSVYRTNSGFIACLHFPYCYEEMFTTKAEAIEAQQTGRDHCE